MNLDDERSRIMNQRMIMHGNQNGDIYKNSHQKIQQPISNYNRMEQPKIINSQNSNRMIPNQPIPPTGPLSKNLQKPLIPSSAQMAFEKAHGTGTPTTPDETATNMYYLSKIVQAVVVIILLAGLFFIPSNLRVLWLIIFGLLFLANTGYELFGSWITLARNTDSSDSASYIDFARYTLITITIMFCVVFIALLLFFAWKLIVLVRNTIEERRQKKKETSVESKHNEIE